jgi:hypothetical protein
LPLPVAIDFDPLLAIDHIVSANTLEEASKAFQECRLHSLCAECASIAGEAPVNKCPGKVQMWGTHLFVHIHLLLYRHGRTADPEHFQPDFFFPGVWPFHLTTFTKGNQETNTLKHMFWLAETSGNSECRKA